MWILDREQVRELRISPPMRPSSPLSIIIVLRLPLVNSSLIITQETNACCDGDANNGEEGRPFWRLSCWCSLRGAVLVMDMVRMVRGRHFEEGRYVSRCWTDESKGLDFDSRRKTWSQEFGREQSIHKQVEKSQWSRREENNIGLKTHK